MSEKIIELSVEELEKIIVRTVPAVIDRPFEITREHIKHIEEQGRRFHKKATVTGGGLPCKEMDIDESIALADKRARNAKLIGMRFADKHSNNAYPIAFEFWDGLIERVIEKFKGDPDFEVTPLTEFYEIEGQPGVKLRR